MTRCALESSPPERGSTRAPCAITSVSACSYPPREHPPATGCTAPRKLTASRLFDRPNRWGSRLGRSRTLSPCAMPEPHPARTSGRLLRCRSRRLTTRSPTLQPYAISWCSSPNGQPRWKRPVAPAPWETAPSWSKCVPVAAHVAIGAACRPKISSKRPSCRVVQRRQRREEPNRDGSGHHLAVRAPPCARTAACGDVSAWAACGGLYAREREYF